MPVFFPFPFMDASEVYNCSIKVCRHQPGLLLPASHFERVQNRHFQESCYVKMRLFITLGMTRGVWQDLNYDLTYGIIGTIYNWR